MKISVIIPVYNAEKYLTQCVDSVLKQTYSYLECILVDDGSTDRSPEICDLYERRDSRVIAIHKKNGGTSETRNAGLKAATGDYVMFMDNDDWWNDKNAISEIVQQLEETDADVLMFGNSTYNEQAGSVRTPVNCCDRKCVITKSGQEALAYIIRCGVIRRAVWTKVVKRKLIIENEIYFPEGMRNEDTDWTAHMLLCADSYDWYENAFYVYRKGTGTAQTDQKVTYRIMSDLMKICEKYFVLCGDIAEPLRKQNVLDYLAYPFAVWLGYIGLLNDKQCKRDRKQMKKWAYVLTYNADPNMKMVSRVYKIAGYTMTSVLLGIYMKCR